MTELQRQLADAHEHMEAAKQSGDFDAEYFWGQEHYRLLHLRQKEMYAEKYPPVHFERVPDEHLLDGSDTSQKAQLDDAGFGSGGIL